MEVLEGYPCDASEMYRKIGEIVIESFSRLPRCKDISENALEEAAEWPFCSGIALIRDSLKLDDTHTQIYNGKPI